jgi:hypothetical protein
MTKFSEAVNAVLVAGVLLAALAGCQKQAGPTEQAGKDADKVVEKATQQIEKAADSVPDVPRKQEGPMERAGKKVDEVADKAGQQIEKAGTSIRSSATGDKK